MNIHNFIRNTWLLLKTRNNPDGSQTQSTEVNKKVAAVRYMSQGGAKMVLQKPSEKYKIGHNHL